MTPPTRTVTRPISPTPAPSPTSADPPSAGTSATSSAPPPPTSSSPPTSATSPTTSGEPTPSLSPSSPVSLSFILPTCGRPTLPLLIESILPQLGPQDEICVVGDGKQLLARGLPNDDPRISYSEFPGGYKGNPQRDIASRRARGTHLCFVDDDDALIAGSVERIRRAVSPRDVCGRPHIFRIPLIRPGCPPTAGSIGGVMFVPPNDPSRLPSWESMDQPPFTNHRGHDSDARFIGQCLLAYPEGPVYHNICTYLVKPHDLAWPRVQLSYRGVIGEAFDRAMSAYVRGDYDVCNAICDTSDAAYNRDWAPHLTYWLSTVVEQQTLEPYHAEAKRRKAEAYARKLLRRRLS